MRLECPGSHGTRGCLTPSPVPFPQCPAPRGPPCKHCPHFRMPLKLPSSTVFAVGVGVKPAEDGAGGHWENLPPPPSPPFGHTRCPAAPSAGRFYYRLGASLQAIQRVRPLAWIVSCLTQRVEWSCDVRVDSGLGASRREIQSRSVFFFFFFLTQGSASQSGPRFYSDTEMVSFPDAGKLTATVTGDVALDDPQHCSEEGASDCSGLSRVLANSRVSYEPQSTVTRHHHHLS